MQPLGDLWVKNEALLEVRSVLLASSIHNHMLQCRPSLVLNHGPPVTDQVQSYLLVLRAEEVARLLANSRYLSDGLPRFRSYSQHVIDLEHVLVEPSGLYSDDLYSFMYLGVFDFHIIAGNFSFYRSHFSHIPLVHLILRLQWIELVKTFLHLRVPIHPSLFLSKLLGLPPPW
jgi:hypothetical protein